MVRTFRMRIVLLTLVVTILSELIKPSLSLTSDEITRFADLRTGMKKTGKILKHNPQGNRWGGKGGLWMGNAELALSLWGPPGKITCSVKKTDVWDRRFFPDPVITLEEYLSKPYDNPYTNLGYYAYSVYTFPCPKPVGQIIVMVPDLEGAPELDAKQYFEDARVEIPLVNSEGTSLGSLHSFVIGSENLYVLHGKTKNLTQPISVRLYKHCDTIKFGESFMLHHILFPEKEEPCPLPGHDGLTVFDYSRDYPDNGPIGSPLAGEDGKFFWIRQFLPPSKTLPEGFLYVMMGVVVGPEVELEIAENQKGLGTPPYRGDESLDLTQKIYGEDQKLIDEVWGLRPRYKVIREAKGVAATARISPDQASDFTVYVTVVTSLDADDPLTTARKNLDSAIQRGYSKLLADQRKWWVIKSANKYVA